MDMNQAHIMLQTDMEQFAYGGVTFDESVTPKAYLTDELRRNYTLAMDAQPELFTSSNAGIPSLLTTFIDPNVIRVAFAPTRAAEIMGEVAKGTWVDDVTMFPMVEMTGEATSYGDFDENGRSGVNTSFPARQSYLFQTIKEYGEREIDRAGLARLNYVAEIDQAAANTLNRFTNFTYFYGVSGLRNYGLLNDPNLSAAITPGTKTAGGVQWVKNGVINGSANEIYADIQALFWQLVSQTEGLIDQNADMILAMSPGSEVALTATNTFNVNVADLLKKNFPRIRIMNAVQYGVTSASNPHGMTAGNLVQLIAPNVQGQQSGYMAYNAKMRAHPVIRMMSSWRQKVTGGTWGAILRMPMAISQMIGV